MTKTRLIARILDGADRLESVIAWIDRDQEEKKELSNNFSDSQLEDLKKELADQSNAISNLAKRLMN